MGRNTPRQWRAVALAGNSVWLDSRLLIGRHNCARTRNARQHRDTECLLYSGCTVSSAAPKRPALELADIVQKYGEAFRQRHVLRREQLAVLNAIERCRTALLGRHLDVCRECGTARYLALSPTRFIREVSSGILNPPPREAVCRFDVRDERGGRTGGREGGGARGSLRRPQERALIGRADCAPHTVIFGG